MPIKFNTGKVQQYTPTSAAYTKLLLHGNNLLDYSGNENDITANGDATAGNSGNPFGFGSVLDLNGSGDSFTLGDVPSFALGTDDFAIDALFKKDLAVESNIFTWYGNGTMPVQFYLPSSGSIGLYGVSSFVLQSSTGLVSTGIWYHVAWVRSGDNWAIYLDGVRVATASSDTRTLGTIANSVTIGPYPHLGSQFFTGTMTEICVRIGTDNGWTGSTIDVPTSPYKVV